MFVTCVSHPIINDLIETLIQDENYDLLLPTLEDILLKISKSKNEI